MKKLVILPVAALALWFGFLFHALPDKSPPAVVLNQYEKAQIQTVLVRTPEGTGTGVVVQRANTLQQPRLFVWTAAHVVGHFDQVEIVRPGRENFVKVDCEMVWSALVIARDEHIDIALLWMDSEPSVFFIPVEFEFSIPRVGDPVYHCGNFYGLNFDGSISTGLVSQIGVQPDAHQFNWHWGTLDQTTAFATRGASGGGIFNMQGKVIGLIVGGLTEGFSCYVPVRILDKWATMEGFSWALDGDWCPQDQILKVMNKFGLTAMENR